MYLLFFAFGTYNTYRSRGTGLGWGKIGQRIWPGEERKLAFGMAISTAEPPYFCPHSSFHFVWVLILFSLPFHPFTASIIFVQSTRALESLSGWLLPSKHLFLVLRACASPFESIFINFHFLLLPWHRFPFLSHFNRIFIFLSSYVERLSRTCLTRILLFPSLPRFSAPL